MRFEISYRGGTTHEVELPGQRRASLGRDPALRPRPQRLEVLAPPRGRRGRPGGPRGPRRRAAPTASTSTAAVEKAQPAGRATPLRLGDVQAEAARRDRRDGVVAPEDLDLRTAAGARPAGADPDLRLRAGSPARARPRAGRPAAPAAPRRRRAAGARAPAAPAGRPRGSGRPPRSASCARLWALFVPGRRRRRACSRRSRLGGGAVGLGARRALASVVAGRARDAPWPSGLRALAPWARHLQIATAAIGLLVCPFTLASATVLLYMTRPEVKAAFEADRPGGRPGRRLGAETPPSRCRSWACWSSAWRSPRSPCSCSEGRRAADAAR